MAARYGEPCSFRAAIWEIGTSTVAKAKAAPRQMERHPTIKRLVRALRSMGKSHAITISIKTANNGEKLDAKSPSTTTIAMITALREVPPNGVI